MSHCHKRTSISNILARLVRLIPAHMESDSNKDIIQGTGQLVRQAMDLPAAVLEANDLNYRVIYCKGLKNNISAADILSPLNNLLILTLTSKNPRQGIITFNNKTKMGVGAAAVPRENLVLTIFTDPPRWLREEELWLLQLIASYMGLAVRNADLTETAKYLQPY